MTIQTDQLTRHQRHMGYRFLTLLLLLMLTHCQSKPEIEVSNILWQNQNGVYHVQFTIRNPTPDRLPIRASIRATRMIMRPRGGQSLDVLGDTHIDLTLEPNASRQVQASLTLKRRRAVQTIEVRAWVRQ